jgi:hypothetical protein
MRSRLSPPPRPFADISAMDTIPPGEYAMAARLRALGWTHTEVFPTFSRYYRRGPQQSRTLIGVSVFAPIAGDPCRHTHYALPVPG